MRLFLVLLFFLGITASVYSQVFEVKTIKDSGPNDSRINFVILPDGYAENELNKFEADAIALSNSIFSNVIFERYKDFFNIHIIKVPSNGSGANHPGTASDEPSNGGHPVKTVDNYFGSTFDFAGIHRLLVPVNSGKIMSVLANNFPNYDQIFVLVNSPFYGGSGGVFATSSTSSSALEIAIHEIGHSFANLADEYESAGGSPREAINATSVTIREQIRWNIWIEESTPLPTPETSNFAKLVGLFEGAVYNSTGWFRPKLDCKMRSLGVPFCEVCAEGFILRF